MPFLSSSPQPSSHIQRVQVHQPVQPQRKPSVFSEFSRHAGGCSRCKHPLEVIRRNDQLCDIGHEIAIEIAQMLYKIGGETASQYEPSNERWIKLNVDVTRFDGPLRELIQAIEHDLANRAPKETSVHYPRPVQVSRHIREASPPPYYSTGSASSSRRPEGVPVPRRSGTIRISVPLEYGHEASYYEELRRELTYTNGSGVIPKFYHAERSSPRPQPHRSNTYKESSSSRTPRKSTVQFNPEVKYYP